MQLKMVVPSLLTEKEVINIRFLIKQHYTFTFANMFPNMDLSKSDKFLCELYNDITMIIDRV